MTIEFTGKVYAVLPLQSGVGQRGPWARATVVFEIPDGRYASKIACENSRNAEAFSKLTIGQEVHVKADVTSREYQGKWYSRIECWEFSPVGVQQPAQQGGMPF
ncbi:MAG: DUF3127 domain-containing protein [Bacteroidales bacterium]|nr:DUF3127 domain-containing protein [Bacteroidales bacterium]